METTFLIISIVLLFLIFTSKEEEKTLEEQLFEDEQQLDISHKDRFYNSKPKEEQFTHPVTGYKGTKSEMDAYIINREKKLRNE